MFRTSLCLAIIIASTLIAFGIAAGQQDPQGPAAGPGPAAKLVEPQEAAKEMLRRLHR